MKDAYPITQEQIDLLNTFTCQRLSDDPDNLRKIQNFHSDMGGGLVHHLRNKGWNTDRSGNIAYYVVKNAQGRIMLFFSLKCGVLFDPAYVERCHDEYIKFKDLWKAHRDARFGDREAQAFLDRTRQEMGQEAYDECMDALRERYFEAMGVYHTIKSDKREEPNDKIIRVDRSHSAIELVDFCVNDRTRGLWKDMFQKSFESRRHTMGQVFFWWFIVPKMIEVSRIAGCEYAYLFAADDDPDGDLVRYYEHALHFRKLTHLGTIKPFYDMNCYFMGRRLFSVDEDSVDPYEVVHDDDDLRGLDYYRSLFFSNFNLRTGVDDIA